MYSVTQHEGRGSYLDISKLEVGMKLNNYPALCKTLGIKPEAGNSKRAQLKNIERFCKLEQIGHSFYIKNIYETPVIQRENRRNTVYGDMVQLLIMDYLIQNRKLSNSATVVNTRNRIMEKINMVNEMYISGNSNITRLSERENLDEKLAYDFFNTTNSNFRGVLERALNNLRDMSLLMYDTVTSIHCKKDGYRLPTEKEKDFILRCERKTLESMGYERMRQVRVSPNWNKFKEDVANLLQSDSDIEFYFQSYQITVNVKYIEQEHERMMSYFISQMKREETQVLLNTISGERLLRNAVNRQTKARIGKGESSKVRLRGEFSNIPDYQRMIDLLILKH